MKAKIVGLEKVDYTSKKTGKPVDGVTFYVEYNDPNVVGSRAEQIYMHTDQLENLGLAIKPADYRDIVGETLEYEYNRFGMIASLALAAE